MASVPALCGVIPALVVLMAQALAVRIEQDAGLPWGEQQLVDAVALRLPAPREPGAELVAVTVAPAAPGRVVLGARGQRRDLWIGDRTGDEAVRLVAVLIVDAVRPPVELEEAPARPPSRLSLFVAPAVTFTLTDAGTSLEPNAGLGFRLTPLWRLMVSGGYARARAIDRLGRQVLTLDAFPLRAGVGRRLGGFELAGGALAQGFLAAGVATLAGVRPGAWLEVLWPIAARGPIHPYVAVGADLLVRRLELQLAGRPALAAGNATPWVALGLSVGGGS